MLRSRSSPLGRWRLAAGLCILAMVVFSVVGCDSRSKRASNYQRLVGPWTPERLRVDGVDVTGQLDDRYGDRENIRIEFQGGQDQPRSYKVVGARSSDTLRIAGGVTVPQTNLLRMLDGFGRPVTWTFTFGELSNSVEFRLPATRTAGSGAFLEAVLPGRGWGEAQRVQLDLTRYQPPDEGANANFSQDG